VRVTSIQVLYQGTIRFMEAHFFFHATVEGIEETLTLGYSSCYPGKGYPFGRCAGAMQTAGWRTPLGLFGRKVRVWCSRYR